MTEQGPNWTLITGSTGAIGGEIVRILAARGDPLILLNRSEIKAGSQRDEILSTHPGAEIELITADLMDSREIADAVDRILALPGRIDALYNNSGVLTGNKVLSAQGYESHFAVNTLAPYQLIRGLRAKMARPADETPAMVVNFSSSAISALKTLELENLANPETVGGLMSTYAQSKLAVTTIVPALAEDLASDNVLIRAIDPGATKSAMTTGADNSGMPKVLAWVAPLFFASAGRQALKVVDSADPTAFGGRSGNYIANRKEKKLPRSAADFATQQKLLKLLDRFLDIS